MRRPAVRTVALAGATLALLVLSTGCGNETRSDVTDAGPSSDAAEDTSASTSDTTTSPSPDVAGDDTAADAGASLEPCVPWDDMCPEGQYCQYVDDVLRCIDEGTVEPDPGGSNPPCPEGVCSRGGICMPNRGSFGGDLICYQPCNVGLNDPNGLPGNADCFNGRHTCWPVEGPDGAPLSFGLCEY